MSKLGHEKHNRDSRDDSAAGQSHHPDAVVGTSANVTSTILAVARLLGRQAAREAFRAAHTETGPSAGPSCPLPPTTRTNEE